MIEAKRTASVRVSIVFAETVCRELERLVRGNDCRDANDSTVMREQPVACAFEGQQKD